MRMAAEELFRNQQHSGNGMNFLFMMVIKSKMFRITSSKNVIFICRKPHELKHKETLTNWKGIFVWELIDEYHNNVTSSEVILYMLGH